MTHFVIRESRSQLLAKCAAKDGFAISKIISSDACKSYLSSRQHQMPNSPSTVWQDIEKYYSLVLDNFKDFVKQSKITGTKFSILIDEWTEN